MRRLRKGNEKSGGKKGEEERNRRAREEKGEQERGERGHKKKERQSKKTGDQKKQERVIGEQRRKRRRGKENLWEGDQLMERRSNHTPPFPRTHTLAFPHCDYDCDQLHCPNRTYRPTRHSVVSTAAKWPQSAWAALPVHCAIWRAAAPHLLRAQPSHQPPSSAQEKQQQPQEQHPCAVATHNYTR